MIGCDLFPTVLEIAAGKQAVEKSPVDGTSLVPLFENPKSDLDRKSLFWHYPHYHAGGFALPDMPSNGPYSAIRSGRWKLIERVEDGRTHLYDLATDLGEQTDVASDHAERVQEMRSELHRWYSQVDAKFLQAKGDGPQPWRP